MCRNSDILREMGKVLRIALCDDDKQFLDKLEKSVIKYFTAEKLKQPEIVKYSSGEEMVRDDGEYDIVFMDIEMGKLSGLKTIKSIKKRNRYAIYMIISSFDEYLDEAMGVRVFRYMTKPINEQRLIRNMRDALRALAMASKKICIETDNGNEYMEEADITMFEVLDGRVVVHTVRGHIDAKGKIQDYISRVNPARFFETARGYLVNLEHVSADNDSFVTLDNGSCRARLSRRKKKEYKNALSTYMNSVETYK